MTWTLKQQDVNEFLHSLDDQSADLIIADPPYNIGVDGGAGWDKIRSETEYLAWCNTWVSECVRVLKPHGMLVVWGTLKTDTFIRFKLEVLNNTGLIDQGELIWENNWGGRTRNNFGRKHEYALCYSKGTHIFNADDVRVPRKMTKSMRTGEVHTLGTIPTRIFRINNHTTSKDFVNWHPTTKNLVMLETIIKAYTNPGALVLDLFSGSGNTTLAALRTGRNALGCELDPTYLDKSILRISKEFPQDSLT